MCGKRRRLHDRLKTIDVGNTQNSSRLFNPWQPCRKAMMFVYSPPIFLSFMGFLHLISHRQKYKCVKLKPQQPKYRQDPKQQTHKIFAIFVRSDVDIISIHSIHLSLCPPSILLSSRCSVAKFVVLWSYFVLKINFINWLWDMCWEYMGMHQYHIIYRQSLMTILVSL